MLDAGERIPDNRDTAEFWLEELGVATRLIHGLLTMQAGEPCDSWYSAIRRKAMRDALELAPEDPEEAEYWFHQVALRVTVILYDAPSPQYAALMSREQQVQARRVLAEAVEAGMPVPVLQLVKAS